MRTLTVATLVILISGAGFAQSDALPQFEIADVHASAPGINPYPSGGAGRGGRYELRRVTMLDMIGVAYGVESDKVLGGPNWLATDRFDVIAKAPTGTKQETINQMLQSLLADRFKLVIRKDTKTLPGFALTVGKGKPKLKETSGSGPSGCQSQPRNEAPGTVPPIVVVCHGMTMEAFAKELRYMGDWPNPPAGIVDATGLQGSWDFELRWMPRALMARAGGDGVPFIDALEKQLGFKLEPRQVPAPVLFVESANQKPTDNPPGIAEKLPPPPPAEFEVADIKPSPPDAPRMARIQNGRVEVHAFPLKNLVMLAWNINNDDMLAGAPKWMDSAKFDLVAKVTTSGPDTNVDVDSLRLMLRALLIERFKMVTHMEDRPVTAYTLVAAKPKMKKAEPGNRTGCREGAPPGMKDPRDANPILSRLITCQNMTMAQFGQELPRLASGYVRTPVMDETGLEGAWDFTLSFSAIGLLQSGPGGPNPNADSGQAAPAASATSPQASDPSGAISLFDAVVKQLGVKLELQKRPAPVLVIEHIEEKPTDN